MSREYFNRYEFFENDGDFKIVPCIEIRITSADKYVQFKRCKDRLDKISQEYYGTPVFGWLILQANPTSGSIEFEIPNNFLLRIPFPLTNTLQEYKRSVELYNLYYGE